MTANANRLTSRAIQTYPVGDVRVFVGALERLGFDSGALLMASGLQRLDLDDPDGHVSCEATGALLAHAARQRAIKNLGVHIASATPIGSYPLLDYVVMTCDTVGAGLTQLARYFRLVSAPAEVALHVAEDPIRVEYSGPPIPFVFEFSIALSLFHLRAETDGRFRAGVISFAHRLDDAPEVERLLGSPVADEAGWNGWTMTRESWSIPMRRRDPVLRGVLERHADEMLTRLPPASAVVRDVRRVVVSRMNAGSVSISAVARELGRSARSLQRDLAAEGVSYQAVVDECRKAAAERYLADASLPVAEVAYLLGYSEPAAFHRAFRRWNGDTPIAFRRRQVR